MRRHKAKDPKARLTFNRVLGVSVLVEPSVVFEGMKTLGVPWLPWWSACHFIGFGFSFTLLQGLPYYIYIYKYNASALSYLLVFFLSTPSSP